MICLFEDRHVEGLYPLTATRHVADLLSGCMTMRERTARLFGVEAESIRLHGRTYLHPLYMNVLLPAIVQEPLLLINGRARIDPDVLRTLPPEPGWIVRRDDVVVAVCLTAEQAAGLNREDSFLDFNRIEGLEEIDAEGIGLYGYLWEMIAANGDAIRGDAPLLKLEAPTSLPSGVHRIGDEALLFGEDVDVQPGVVFDTTSGPILLGDRVTVMANSVIQGPCSIGGDSTVKIGAKIYHDTSIGPRCKVGGEVENSIILGYSNKQHDGFLGHSYLGAWVNLGADTNTSDLKNNYGPVRVTLRGEEIDSGTMFLGSLIGDHGKTGINTMLNTGTVIGPFANIFGGGFPPKEIGPFSWCNASEVIPYRLEKGLDLAARVMERRGVRLSQEERDMLTYLYRAEHGEDQP